MSQTPMMKCGHSANAVNSKGDPSCIICLGIHPGAEEIDENAPSLVSRKATCSYCGKAVPSNSNLAFFEYRGQGTRHESSTDSYYCGCRGWD